MASLGTLGVMHDWAERNSQHYKNKSKLFIVIMLANLSPILRPEIAIRVIEHHKRQNYHFRQIKGCLTRGGAGSIVHEIHLNPSKVTHLTRARKIYGKRNMSKTKSRGYF